jgi:anthranilate synthase component 2
LRLLVLDNYDSFTYNLVHLIEKVSEIQFDVLRNDKVSITEINAYDKILLSPGPGLPKDAGIMPELIKHYGSSKDMLGVCLGLQAIGEAYQSKLKNLKKVFHGIATPITIIEPDVIFNNCPPIFSVGRYHSWVIDTYELSKDLKITAVDEDGNIMALKHAIYPIRGVQFHPESILSEFGETIIKNWLES